MSTLIQKKREKIFEVDVAVSLHQTPGRMRVRTEALKRDKLRGKALAELLGQLPGVITSHFNSITGSLTIHYDELTTHSDSVIAYLRAEGLCAGIFGFPYSKKSKAARTRTSELRSEVVDQVIKIGIPLLIECLLSHATKGLLKKV